MAATLTAHLFGVSWHDRIALVVLTPYNLPTFTAPFCVVTSVMVIGGPSFGRIWAERAGSAPPSATAPGTTMTWN